MTERKERERIRTIITQDAEVDDQNSLRHFLLYTNEVELQGIIQTSSVFHWQGIRGAQAPARETEGDPAFTAQSVAYDQPYRWPGTAWMDGVIDDYAAVYPNLRCHDSRYPGPATLRGLIRVGNIGYPGEMETATQGSELIRRAMLDEDPRRLYLQVWGGTNTIARALYDIQTVYQAQGERAWEEIRAKLSDKVVITACGEQDTTYRDYIAQEWPQIPFVRCLQMGSYAYAWNRMPEGESKDTLRADFMKANLLSGKGALLDGYATWADGKHYEGEEEGSQFGSNPALLEHWWGAERGLGTYAPYDFISEGDSPTFFMLLDWGLRTTEDFSFGGFSGRYRRDETQRNEKGEPLNYWIPQQDVYTDRAGQSVETESMWRYVAEIQNDFAARADWCVTKSYAEAEHAPVLEVAEGTDLTASAGSAVRLHAAAKDPDGEAVTISFRIYEEASEVRGAKVQTVSAEAEALLLIPESAERGETLHVIVRAQKGGAHRLTHYQQVVVRVE
ncbi:MAG: DUF1593 domain-containing protein [Eubacteriales bacterium]|nr:DUF1593 domain-containing protein [Eubacteriales bacterium]